MRRTSRGRTSLGPTCLGLTSGALALSALLSAGCEDQPPEVRPSLSVKAPSIVAKPVVGHFGVRYEENVRETAPGPKPVTRKDDRRGTARFEVKPGARDVLVVAFPAEHRRQHTGGLGKLSHSPHATYKLRLGKAGASTGTKALLPRALALTLARADKATRAHVPFRVEHGPLKHTFDLDVSVVLLPQSECQKAPCLRYRLTARDGHAAMVKGVELNASVDWVAHVEYDQAGALRQGETRFEANAFAPGGGAWTYKLHAVTVPD